MKKILMTTDSSDPSVAGPCGAMAKLFHVGLWATVLLAAAARAEHAPPEVVPALPAQGAPRTEPPKETFSGKVLPVPDSLPFTVGADQKAFYSLYRRPNDDTFQNGGDATKPGVPFQVGWMWCSLVSTENPDGTLKGLDFRWDFRTLTGRHAEAPTHFKLRESRSSLAGEDKPVKYPGRARDKEEKGLASVSLKYRDGVTEASPSNKKRGTDASSLLSVIRSNQTPLADGEYSGDLELRIDPKKYLGAGKLDGLEQIDGNNGPKEGVYKRINWKVRVTNGKITAQDVNCARFNENQPLQLADNNLKKESPFKTKGYPEQTAAGECGDAGQNLGNGDLPGEESPSARADRLSKKIGKVIETAGCLSCHGNGTGDNFRFCDDGRPIRPSEDAFKLYSMMLTGVPHRPTPPQYPRGMVKSVIEIRAQMLADKTGAGVRGTLREWVESQKTEAKILSLTEEYKAMELAQSADIEKAKAPRK